MGLYVIGLWRMHGMIVRALRLEFDNETTARMKEIPIYILSMMALPNSEHLSSFAPVIRRSKS
jgi:hypothetical protein